MTWDYIQCFETALTMSWWLHEYIHITWSNVISLLVQYWNNDYIILFIMSCISGTNQLKWFQPKSRVKAFISLCIRLVPSSSFIPVRSHGLSESSIKVYVQTNLFLLYPRYISTHNYFISFNSYFSLYCSWHLAAVILGYCGTIILKCELAGGVSSGIPKKREHIFCLIFGFFWHTHTQHKTPPKNSELCLG